MCTIESSNGLCKGRLEAVAGVMDPVAESCGRDAQVARVWGHTKKSDVPHTPGAEGRGRAQHPHVAPCPARFGGLRAQPPQGQAGRRRPRPHPHCGRSTHSHAGCPPSQCASAPSRQRRCPASRGSRGRWKRPFDFPILRRCGGLLREAPFGRSDCPRRHPQRRR
jgi:hypothetical protein